MASGLAQSIREAVIARVASHGQVTVAAEIIDDVFPADKIEAEPGSLCEAVLFASLALAGVALPLSREDKIRRFAEEARLDYRMDRYGVVFMSRSLRLRGTR